jgi:hypothetical protein
METITIYYYVLWLLALFYIIYIIKLKKKINLMEKKLNKYKARVILYSPKYNKPLSGIKPIKFRMP